MKADRSLSEALNRGAGQASRGPQARLCRGAAVGTTKPPGTEGAFIGPYKRDLSVEHDLRSVVFVGAHTFMQEEKPCARQITQELRGEGCQLLLLFKAREVD